MFKVTFLSKENDLNKILRNQKRSRETINILFTSLWDKYSSELLEKIREKYQDSIGEDLFIVDSFHMPHSFIIYEVVKIPQLVVVRKDSTYLEDYLPKIYEYLDIK
jgi:hypothetical protein